ncbi:unnamed protein product [Allacma fusca]|uniref:MARVEL domain-containing protein n=1 Tax=Allacma fusca TaxID=39272 RepID=A0A8J2KHA2_9HEXA|nr:unnamed protein product [Allacma fusca]
MSSIGSYLFSLQGVLKLLNIIFGLISFGCIIQAFEDELKSEMFFVVSATGALVASVLFYPVFLLTSALDNNKALKFIDFIYHVLIGILLLVASSLMLKSAVDNNGEVLGSSSKSLGQLYYDKKVSAGSFGIINSLVYLAASVFVITSQNEDDFAMSTRYSK